MKLTRREICSRSCGGSNRKSFRRESHRDRLEQSEARRLQALWRRSSCRLHEGRMAERGHEDYGGPRRRHVRPSRHVSFDGLVLTISPPQHLRSRRFGCPFTQMYRLERTYRDRRVRRRNDREGEPERSFRQSPVLTVGHYSLTPDSCKLAPAQELHRNGGSLVRIYF